MYSFRRKSVSSSGLAALILISFSLIWLDQIALLLVLFYMFASSSLLSALQKKKKQEMEKVLSKSGPRDYVQALANLGVATAFILLHSCAGEPIWMVAAIGSVAAGNSDSWASEIGALSKQSPVSILGFRPLAPGISGGITGLGTLAGLLGSLFIAGASVLTVHWMDTMMNAPAFLVFLAASLAGFLGMLFDSLLGALFQALYQDPFTLELTENAQGNRLMKGLPWMNNDMVNFLSTLFGGLVAVLFYWVLQ